MKQIARYVLTAAMMLASALGAQAQTDPDATIKAITKVIWKHEQNAEHFIQKEIYPKFKKNPEVLTGIAKAYNAFNDSTIVFSYIDKALAVDAKYVPAHVLRGTVYRMWGDTLKAYSNYDLAIAMNPKDPEGYLAYARLMANEKNSQRDVEGAVRKLEELANVNPEANIYVEIGRLYVDAIDLKAGLDYTNQAIDAYSKADIAFMTPKQIEGYVRLLQGAGAGGAGVGAYNRSDSILSLALLKYPSNADLNRLLLQNCVNKYMKKYEQALDAADALFNKSDSLEIDFTDFINYGDAYLGLKRYDDAIAVYQKCVDYEIKRSDYKSDEAYENMKRREDRQKGEAMKKIVAAYEKKGYPELAIEEYEKYMAYRKTAGKLSSSDINELAELYVKQADFLNGEEKLSVYRKAFDTYDEMAKLAFSEQGMEDNALIAYAQRISIASQVLDKEQVEGLGISDAEEIIRLCPIDAELNGLQKRCLKLSVRFLAYYYLQKDQYKQLSKYYMMLEKIAPDDNLYVTLSTNKVYRKKMGIR